MKISWQLKVQQSPMNHSESSEDLFLSTKDKMALVQEECQIIVLSVKI